MRDRTPCESCRVSEECFRYGPCAMCVEHRVRVRVGEAICALCSRPLSRFILVRKGERSMTVGTSCVLKAMADGWVEDE